MIDCASSGASLYSDPLGRFEWRGALTDAEALRAAGFLVVN